MSLKTDMWLVSPNPDLVMYLIGDNGYGIEIRRTITSRVAQHPRPVSNVVAGAMRVTVNRSQSDTGIFTSTRRAIQACTSSSIHPTA